MSTGSCHELGAKFAKRSEDKSMFFFPPLQGLPPWGVKPIQAEAPLRKAYVAAR
jgi:hypothetical protein